MKTWSVEQGAGILKSETGYLSAQKEEQGNEKDKEWDYLNGVRACSKVVKMGRYRPMRKRSHLHSMPTFQPLGASAKARHWARLMLLAMMMTLWGMAPASGQTPAHPWRDNLTRDDIVKALGEPQGDVGSSAAERMIYKGGLLIVLSNNLVTEIDGDVPEALRPAGVAASAAPAPTVLPAAKPVAAAASASVAAKATVAVAASTTPASMVAPYAGQSTSDQESEKIISDFSTTSIVPQGTPLSGVITKALGPGSAGGAGTASLLAQATAAGASGTSPAAELSPWARTDTWQGFLAGLLLKTVLMTFVLKGAFHWKDFPILWREATLVAVGVSLCNQILAWVFSLNDFGKIAATVQADQIISGAVLLALIMNFTQAKQFPRAAAIMITAMGANIALGYVQVAFM